ncbi:MAG: hypothetical protein AAF611_00140 [Bacteroidota bacterium]
MSKTITLHNKRKTAIRSVRVRNDEAILSIKINKIWLLTWMKRFVIMSIFIGYIGLAYVSYSINEAHFWTLVKVGVILSMLLFFALSKSNKIK